MTELPPGLAAFARGEADPSAFPHREHVRMGYEMLRRHDFAQTAHLYSRALRSMAARAGKPEAFHQTVTLAFLSLIAERMPDAEDSAGDFAGFANANPDLFEKTVLARWYRPGWLASDAARRTFLLPEPWR
ncbi:MAG: hypothetical protein ACREHE_13665 [Rhizomicrobium sp.]